MLEEVFLLEEEKQNYGILIVLGLVSAFTGFIASRTVFPTQVDVLAVIFASIPMIYSLTEKFLDDEAEGKPHIPELKTYFSIFVGQALAFAIISLKFPEVFDLQRSIIGASGAAVAPASFEAVISNNMMVFSAIFMLSLLIGSAGAFILTWNASVFGVFMANLFTSKPLMIFAYLPHSVFEMLGFITAGVSGSLISAAIYRKHFTEEVWNDYLKLVGLGVALVFIGAFLETA